MSVSFPAHLEPLASMVWSDMRWIWRWIPLESDDARRQAQAECGVDASTLIGGHVLGTRLRECLVYCSDGILQPEMGALVLRPWSALAHMETVTRKDQGYLRFQTQGKAGVELVCGSPDAASLAHAVGVVTGQPGYRCSGVPEMVVRHADPVARVWRAVTENLAASWRYRQLDRKVFRGAAIAHLETSTPSERFVGTYILGAEYRRSHLFSVDGIHTTDGSSPSAEFRWDAVRWGGVEFPASEVSGNAWRLTRWDEMTDVAIASDDAGNHWVDCRLLGGTSRQFYVACRADAEHYRDAVVAVLSLETL